MFDQLPFFTILPFFHTQTLCYEALSRKLSKMHNICDFEKYKNKTAFAKLQMGWNAKGLSFIWNVKTKNMQKDPEENSIEIFIDTRDTKNQNYFSRFCHHFIFYPLAKDNNIQAKEITRFHADDIHMLAHPNDFFVDLKYYKTSYQMHIHIPEKCLYGYEPQRFTKLGFSYRVNRGDDNPQVLTTPFEEFKVDRNPSVWSTLLLSSPKGKKI